VLFEAQRSRMHSKENYPPYDIIFFGEVGEQLSDRRVIFVWVHWRTTAVVRVRRFYDPPWVRLDRKPVPAPAQ
jgi:hypothetical protein